MRKSLFMLSAAGVVVVGTILPPTLHDITHAIESLRARLGTNDRGVRMFVSYVTKPTSVEALVKVADVVAVVTALQVYPGRSVWLDESGATGRRLQFQLVDFRVDEVLKGDVTALTLERLDDTQNGRPVVRHHDGGAFGRGRHLLFLQKQADSPFYFLVNDEARFTVNSRGRLDTVGHGPVAQRLRGMSLGVARDLIRRSLATAHQQ